LTELKTSAKTGADSINNSILPGGITIGVAYLDNLINSYSSDYNDLFTNTMPDSSVYGNSADNNGIWKLEDGSTLTVVNNGGCWLFSGTVSKIYQATYEGSFTVSGSEFTEYKRFILKDINGINPDINATLSIAVVTRSIDYDIMTVDVKLRALSGIIDNNSFSSQQARLSTADVVEYRDIVCRLSTRTQPPLGTGLGGLGGVSTVLGTYSDPFNSPVDGSVTVNVTVTGFFANDPCAR
jgi:hypothetical protein